MGSGIKNRACCCCMPYCTCRIFLNMTVFCLLLSVGVAYAIKALWIRGDWDHSHHASSNDTTPEPFSWRAATEEHQFAAWDRQYYLPALFIAVLLDATLIVFVWYIIGTCAQCGFRGCRALHRRCRNPCGSSDGDDDGDYNDYRDVVAARRPRSPSGAERGDYQSLQSQTTATPVATAAAATSSTSPKSPKLSSKSSGRSRSKSPSSSSSSSPKSKHKKDKK